jgi:2-polyprenyl-6-methoxyphenol hydroxylase-like FAD-dependent oxidoreductase
MSAQPADVVIVGYGPVGQALALMLGRQGRSVAVCERWANRYPLPRAVCIDHELYRVLCANGLSEVLPRVSHAGPLYRWFNADWQELLCIDWSATSISGGPEVNFVHQPTLEEALDAAVRGLDSVDTLFGWEALSIEQDDDLAHVRIRDCGTGEERSLSAQFVVGCDGANSLVRQAIGGAQEDRGFEADWLVIDVRLNGERTLDQLGIPAAAQYCNPARPTTIVPAGVRDGAVFRRWEFMRLPGETIEALEREERVRELLRPWLAPDDADLIRHKVYTFRSLLAERWRERRLLLAGDAAHVMPPFMGQGMCSGLRDAWNLAWKLALILDGTAPDALLDTYQLERMPHVSQIIDLSIYLGRIICIPDPAGAADRDRRFLSGEVDPPPPFPQLVDGVLHRDGQGRIAPGAGKLTPHVLVREGDTRRRLDDHTGGGFTLIRGERCGDHPLPVQTRATLDRLGITLLDLSADVDAEGKLRAFLDQHGWTAMIVRPDFYAYGGVSDPRDLPGLVESLLVDLAGSDRALISPLPRLHRQSR